MGEGELQPQEEERGKEVAGVMGGGARDKEEVGDAEGEDEEAPFKPFVFPGEWGEKDNGSLSQSFEGLKRKHSMCIRCFLSH